MRKKEIRNRIVYDMGVDLEVVSEVWIVAAALRLEVGQILELSGDHQQVVHHFLRL